MDALFPAVRERHQDSFAVMFLATCWMQIDFSCSVSPCLVLRSHFSLVQLSGPGGNGSVRLDQYIKTVLDSVTMSWITVRLWVKLFRAAHSGNMSYFIHRYYTEVISEMVKAMVCFCLSPAGSLWVMSLSKTHNLWRWIKVPLISSCLYGYGYTIFLSLIWAGYSLNSIF